MRVVLIIVLICFALKANAQVDTIVWQSKSPLPSTARIDYASFVIDSNYYIIGGQDGSGDWYSQVWRYNIQSNSWQQMRDFPGGPISTVAGFAINGHGYICSGSDSLTGYNNDNEFWEYYPSVDTWQHKPNFPGTPHEAPVSFVYDNFAFIGLGWGPGAFNFWRYDAVADGWDSLSSPPNGNRWECGISVIDSFAYIYDGIWVGYYNDIWRYNINQDHWDSIGVTPGYGRSNPLFWTFDSIIIIGYGFQEYPPGNFLIASDLYSYDTKHNKWDTLTCSNFLDSTADGGGAGCFVNGRTGYFYGGYKTDNPNYSFTNKMWSFDASRFFPKDTTTGISAVHPDVSFAVYPNPSHSPLFSISTSESGDVIFSDALGRVIDERRLKQGVNQISLTTDDEVVFYHATLQYGATANGKVVFLR